MLKVISLLSIAFLLNFSHLKLFMLKYSQERKGAFGVKIGIPRGLTYYTYYPFWHAFFTELGVEIVLSDKTTKQIVSEGSGLVVTETCLPVKVYVGHVLNLLDKGLDIIYCPSIQSIEPKIYNCSKIRGLPDLIRNVIKRNYLLIEPTFDMSEKGQTFDDCLYQSVIPLGIKDKKKVKKAALLGALSGKVAEDCFKVIDAITAENYKTKVMADMLKAVNAGKKALVVFAEKNEKAVASCRNIPGVTVAYTNTLNVYDILNCDTVVIEKAATEKITEVYA